jgi:DNA processing protein
LNASEPWPVRRELRALCRLLTFQVPMPRIGQKELASARCLSALAVPGDVAEADTSVIEDRIQRWRSTSGGGLVLFHDPCYPPLLREIGKPPLGLFLCGDVAILHSPAVAVVGARAAAASYREWTHDTCAALARCGIVIASGMARGIDAEAHRGALAAAGKTVAVTGSGLDLCYPPENAALQRQIEASGCVVSELLPGTPPRPWHFPSRNRILAGLVRAVVVVQAEWKSGALITARLALQENRDVMAVPGDIQDPRSRGPHRLLRSGACLVETAADILRELGWQRDAALPGAHATDEQAILSQLWIGPLAVDALRTKLGWDASRVQRALFELELVGLVEHDAQGRVRVASS